MVQVKITEADTPYTDHQLVSWSLTFLFSTNTAAISEMTPIIRLVTTPSRLISDLPPSPTPHFYAGCPSCCNPPTLSWLGTGTKYTGLGVG